ncbi:DUF881 domain-containing protein [Ferdinandcohnia quinoae]|uniref:DUF881 domain-containing protein n=1 Tax=Fredinandcohnia quinoae TaxID=2918902 RepID=A0AAW5DXU4_9BACI|nr:DUF881 domain-containing protein [Fredinandcohnia sp. SECRCQ15]MCH1623870.1 DUF881 domain-containing protein [Fredinandcohnia sp. SECRCQ15]
MDKKTGLSFIIISVVIGFMIAVQFKTIQEPEIRDTRDLWELREDLKQSQELYSDLLSKIYTYEAKLEKYENERDDSKMLVLQETLEELKKEAGLTTVTEPGLIIKIEQSFNEAGIQAGSISPSLLKWFINELNSYQANEISIDGHRVISTTVIREIQGRAKIDSYPIHSLPIEIKVTADDAERLYNKLKASEAERQFFIDNLRLVVSKPSQAITIPAYDDPIRVKHMEPDQSEKEGGK